jgi:hypothetical protein
LYGKSDKTIPLVNESFEDKSKNEALAEEEHICLQNSYTDLEIRFFNSSKEVKNKIVE